LGEPELREQAAKEAAAADILVVSMHGTNRLATEAEACLKQWVGLKRSKPCALVISLDDDAKPLADKNPSLAELRAVATRTGIAVLLQFAEPASPIIGVTIADIQRRANSSSHIMGEVLRQQDPQPYPRGRINE
jgi:hypothetical protein